MFRISTVEGDIASGLPDRVSAMRALRSAVDDRLGCHGTDCHHGMIVSSGADGTTVAFYTGDGVEDKESPIVMSQDD